MYFTFQGGNPAGTGMSTRPKQLIMSAIRGIGRGAVRAGVATPKQVLLIMQLSAFLLLALGLQVSAATYSQTVSFTGKDVPLKTVFASVKKQTGYGVFFENGEAMLQSSAPVTLDLKNVSLEMFLRVCLKDQPLDYVLEGKTIFIKKKEVVVAVAPSGDSILQIKGRVTNDKGEPLVNANITVKRTGHGTITDANGNFYLRNVNSADVVMVSFIGYKMQNVPLKDRVNLMVVLEATKNELDKVVVQAYGTTSQRLATGNIGTVRAEDIEKHPVMDPLLALQGQIPGAVITQNSGNISGSIKMEIRGRNSINSNFPSDPLYIIDGVPLTILDLNSSTDYQHGSQGFTQAGINSPAVGQSPFFNINPQDIESIEILKDADATAIYGSRGANGVILITTKKGHSGKTKLDINAQQGASTIIRYYKMLSTPEYISMRREALNNDGVPIDENYAPDLTVWDTTRYTDWQKYSWGGTGKITDFQVSLSGGDIRNIFRIASDYRKQTDITTESGAFQRGSLSFDFQHKGLNQKFGIELSTNYSYSSVDMIYMPYIALLPPNAPSVYDSKGKLNWEGWTPLQDNFVFGNFLQPYKSKTNFLTSSLQLNYQILAGLTARINFGYNTYLTNQKSISPIASQNPQYAPTGSSTFGYTNGHNIIAEPQLEYNGFVFKGKLNILLGASTQSSSTDGLQVIGQGYKDDELLQGISNAPSKNSYDNYSEYKYTAIFGRINYNLENKYILNINARRDGSSRFGPGRQFGNFGSLGAAWLFSEEKLIKNNLKFLSFGKIRGSYGTTGSDHIGNYQYINLWTSIGTYPYNGVSALIPLGHSDSLLHWETNRKLEVALALGFIKDRITLEIAKYRNRCNDQLVAFPTPNFSGFTNVTANSPANVENTGWEFTLNSKLVDKANFKWSMNYRIGINRNKLISYPNISQSPYAGSLIVGQSLNIKRLLHYTGIDKQTGLYTFQDKDKDGQITLDLTGKSPDDRYPSDLSTKFDGSLSNTFDIKNFQVSTFIYFRKQKGLNALLPTGIPGQLSNQPQSVMQRWQKPGDITNVARFTSGNGNSDLTSDQNFFQYSDGVYTDASFIRLQNVSISYSLPNSIIKNADIQQIRIFLRGENLFVITKYKGLDPETQNFGGLPIPRSFTAGMSINF